MSQAMETVPETPQTRMDAVCAFAFRYRGMLAGLPLVYAFLETRWEWENDWVAWAFALALAAAGASLRGWARCSNQYSRGQKKTLAVGGPYAIVRNPLYVGNVLIITGAGVASELTWFLPVVVLWAYAVYSAVIRYEEKRLSSKYGPAYDAYRLQVGAWFPHFRRIVGIGPMAPLREFLRVSGLQFVYSLILLVPFLMKDLVPLHILR